MWLKGHLERRGADAAENAVRTPKGHLEVEMRLSVSREGQMKDSNI